MKLLIAAEGTQAMQNSLGAWFVEYGLPVLFLVGIPAIVLCLVGWHMEVIVCDSLRPGMNVAKNARQERIVSMYQHHRLRLDLILLVLYATSFLLVLATGVLLAGITGLVVGLIVAVDMFSDLRHGIRLQSRVEKRLEREKRFLDGNARLFG